MAEVLDELVRTIVDPIVVPGRLVVVITALLAVALALTARVVAALLEVSQMPNRRRPLSRVTPPRVAAAAGSDPSAGGSDRSGSLARHRPTGAA